MYCKILDDGSFTYGPNVHAPGFTLLDGHQDEYDLPVDGWHWFASAEDARQAWGVRDDPGSFLSPELP